LLESAVNTGSSRDQTIRLPNFSWPSRSLGNFKMAWMGSVGREAKMKKARENQMIH
jgi:hypothetical protein